MDTNSIDVQVSAKLGTKVKPYSTDLAAAWEMVESMKYERIKITKRWDKGWECHIITDDITKATADTAPRAICLAFLKLGEP